jgi:hypothetical protein
MSGNWQRGPEGKCAWCELGLREGDMRLVERGHGFCCRRCERRHLEAWEREPANREYPPGTQRDLFRPMCGKQTARQGTLFEQAGHGRESADTCPECGTNLVETGSGYWCCPVGHGKLLPQEGGEA